MVHFWLGLFPLQDHTGGGGVGGVVRGMQTCVLLQIADPRVLTGGYKALIFY